MTDVCKTYLLDMISREMKSVTKERAQFIRWRELGEGKLQAALEDTLVEAIENLTDYLKCLKSLQEQILGGALCLM